ncbi:MAG TPA: helix-hairpin-helix domain-containing protein [Candidatus Methylomirabilis sp.]|jgi:hypothetical protein
MLINLNSASLSELTQLPRVGADKARRIVRHRAIRKGFRDWDDFATTPGVAEEDVKAIRLRAWIGPGPEVWRLPPDSRRRGRRTTAVRRPRAKTS